MIHAIYLTNKYLDPLFQYSTASECPTFQQLARKLHDHSQSWSNAHSTTVSSHTKICKHHSSPESLIFWALCSDSTDSLQVSALLRDLELEIAHYFDKHQLTQQKLNNNLDRLAMLCHVILDSSEPLLLNSTDLQRIIPLRADLARFLKNTTSSLARVASTTRSRAPPSFSSNSSLDTFNNSSTSNISSAPAAPTANEVLLDIIERFSAVYDSSGNLIRSTTTGHVDLTCSLPGSAPLLELLLKGGPLTHCPTLGAPQNMSWHDSVLTAYHSNHNVFSTSTSGSAALRFSPPSGKIRLCEYSLSTASKGLPPGIISLQMRKSLGTKQDEFEIRLEISTHLQVHEVERVSVTLRLDRSFEGKVRAITSTHGRLENQMSRGIAIWHLDSKMESGTLAVLRCVSESDQTNDVAVYPTELLLTFEHAGAAASGFKVQTIDVQGTAYNKPFKGVKYSTQADSVVYRLR